MKFQYGDKKDLDSLLGSASIKTNIWILYWEVPICNKHLDPLLGSASMWK